MATTENKIFNDIKDPTILEVGAELKKKYEKLKTLLVMGNNPIHLAENLTDEEFKAMAKHAIEKRELEIRTVDNDHVYIPFEQISRRVDSLGEENLRKWNIKNFNLDSLIPTDETIKKIADTVSEASEETKESKKSIAFSGLIKMLWSNILSLFGKGEGLSWDEGNAQVASERTQENIEKKLSELKGKDYNVRNFLNQKTADQSTVEANIIKAVPQGVYEELKDSGLKVSLPEELKIPQRSNPIEKAVVEPAPKIDVDETISKIRDKVLYPKGKPSLEQQIAGQILDRSNKELKEARQAYDNASFTNPLEGARAYSRLRITEQLALQEGDANKMGAALAGIIAAGFEQAVQDPKFTQLKDKKEMVEFIAQKVTAKLEENKNNEHLTIVKTINDEVVSKAVNIAEYVSGKSDYAKNFIEDGLNKLPPRVGENQYAVVNVDKVKPDIIAGIYENINDKTFSDLKLASRAVALAQKNKPTQQATHQNPVFNKARETCTTQLGAVTECSDITVPANHRKNMIAESQTI